MKFHVQTWGCQMNDHDGERLAGLLAAQGFQFVASSDEADLVLLNTCSIREKAVHKVYSELGRLRAEKEKRPLLIGVTGCLAQQEQEALFKRAPQIDFVLGTMALKQLPSLVEQAQAGRSASSTPANIPTTTSSRRRSRSAAAPPRPSSPSPRAATTPAPTASCPPPGAPSGAGPGRTSSPRSAAWWSGAGRRWSCWVRT